MFTNLTLRAKVLLGIAVACTGYVVLMPDTAQTIEPTREATIAPTSHVIHPASGAAGARKAPLMKASFRAADRIVRDGDGDGAVAALFSAHSWFVAPPPPPPAPVVYQPPAAPTAPPLPFAFMGSYKSEGGGATYFLTAGDRVYDVKVGDTLDNTYSIDGVKAGQLLLTYMPLKIQQSIAVGDE